MMVWKSHHPKFTIEMLGAIPSFLNDEDPRDAKTQIDTAYGFAGGWRPLPGWTMAADHSIKYPGDPALPVLCETQLRDERIYYYQHSWVAVVQPDGSFEVCRLD